MSKPKNWNMMNERERNEWRNRQREYDKKRYYSEPKLMECEWLCPKSAAKIIGVSAKTIIRAIGRGDLPAMKFGERAIRISKSDFDSYVSGCKFEPSPEPAGYISQLLGIPTKCLKENPELLDAKRHQMKILRELKPRARKQQNAPEPRQPVPSPR